MRIVETLSPADVDSVLAVVITGNGRTEQKVLKYIAKRYNGKDKILHFPKSHKSKKTGLGVFDALKELEIIGYGKVIVLLDKEHFSREELIQKVKKILPGSQIQGSNPIRIFREDLEVHLILFGNEKAIEENIAELIRLEFNEEIPPTKSAIRSFLKVRGLKNYKRLFTNASLDNIEKAFKPLITAIKLLEGES